MRGLLAGEVATGALESEDVRRSFFGVHRVAVTDVPALGPTRLLFNGATVHGAQAVDEMRRCRPVAYYVPAAPIPQTLQNLAAAKPRANVAVVGLGAGAVAAYSRPGDLYRFFEIDPAVVEVARDSGAFSFLTTCARGAVDYRLGDARLTLARESRGSFDLILLDAFSSDSVPTHLLTVQAIKGYLEQLAPDGALVVHLTNRNLDLLPPAAAVAREAGLVSAYQVFVPTKEMGPPPGVAGSMVMVMARDEAALKRIAAGSRWSAVEPGAGRAWTDDYTNILGALISKLMQ